MTLAAPTAETQRVVPTTQSRLTPAGQEQQEESVDGQGMVDDDDFPDDREVWEVTHVREEDLETNEVEGVDFLSELLEMVGWGQVDDEET